jgi:hypothetical protein
MPCSPPNRESYLIRLWTEHDDDTPVLRGSIQNVQTGRKTYFDALDLPVQLLRESAERLVQEEAHAPLH